MPLNDDFIFRPLPPILNPVHFPFPIPNPLGPLADLAGEWGGKGFNVIWRPNHTPPGQDHFLELNLTLDSINFTAISGAIPNRGLLQPDINIWGVHFPVLDGTENPASRMFLECAECHAQEVVHLDVFELEVFLANRFLRYLDYDALAAFEMDFSFGWPHLLPLCSLPGLRSFGVAGIALWPAGIGRG